MILTDFDGHTDSVMIPILDWLRVNQSELLVNMDKSAEGLKFEADMLDRSKVDLSLTLPLTERVIVTRRGGGGFAVEHAAEPNTRATPSRGLSLYLRMTNRSPPGIDGDDLQALREVDQRGRPGCSGVVESDAQVDLSAQKRGRKGPFLLPVIPKVFPKRSHFRVQRWRTSMKSSTCVAEA